MYYKEHVPLIIALVLPLLFIIGVVVFSGVTGAVHTAYDALYVRCPQQNGMWRPCAIHTDAAYVVNGERITRRVVPPQQSASPQEKPIAFVIPKLYRFNTDTHASTLLTDEALAVLPVVGIDEAPDGTRLVYSYGNGGDIFPFVFGSRRAGFFLVQGSHRERVTFTDDIYAGTENVEIIGWTPRSITNTP